ncbi:hypothetical protein Pmar_PMAR028479 [Perkinsus marinus ATCC 50983]|uniref:Uncharacterized protein n=1 Tax=Perkinsus marinus (strain ATCC 50983 / TXsc) TaxID=423536 RepID=C5LM88_PERM5|nr:hypothetical protein Pmar_PMAR028479 [Perkinsus marinus ATCC 50983]EER02100.1 hypothetical protein Pmar_PMAR028479 [Perkinsus marinus ATCC 50983]|eukprot:XP_002769382.1 hypothetical protein Pmar_PMAR028479 [Perkinsus marinus ATCC 50983]
MAEAAIRARKRDDALVIFEEIWLGRRAQAAERFKGKVALVDALNPVKAGDTVILFDGRPTSKLGPKASGPYVVIRCVGKQCYEISSDGSREKSAIIHDSRLRKYEAYSV